MEEKVIKYKSGDIKVLWKPNLCYHSEKCWRGLPEVFKPKEKPWIQTEGVDNDKIIEQVKRCPSGALDYEPKLNDIAESKSEVTVEVAENGPLLVNGLVKIKQKDGEVEEKKKAAFCRCGASESKPFCDGSHTKINFKG